MKPTMGAIRYFGLILNGTTPASGNEDYWGGDVLWATPEDLGKLAGSRISTTRRQVTQKAVEETNLSVLPAGSILISTRAPIGHMAITASPMAFNQGCRGIIPRNGIHGPFLYYLLKSRTAELNAIANGTTFVELSRDELATTRIAIPPLDVQHRIAQFLDEKTARIDSLIEKKQELLDRLAEKRQALITRAVTKGLNPDAPMKDSGIDWLGEVPDSWRLEKLKFFAEVRNSNVDKLTKDDEVPVRLCNYTDVYYNERITPDLDFMEATATETEIERFQLRRGQVILTKDSESWDDIGIPALVTEDMPEVLCGYHLTVFEPGKELDGGFLAWLFRSEPMNDQFKVAANGVTRYGLGMDAMKNALAVLPPLDVQRRIARFLEEQTDRMDALNVKINSSMEMLSEYRSALVTAAVTGQIVGLR